MSQPRQLATAAVAVDETWIVRAAARLPHVPRPPPSARCRRHRRRRRRHAAAAGPAVAAGAAPPAPVYSGAVVIAAFVSGLGGAVIGAIGVGCVLVRRAGAPSLAAALRQGSELLASDVAREHGCFGAAPRDGRRAGEWRGDAGVVAPSEIAGRSRWSRS